MNSNEAVNQARRHHHAGRLAEAENIYRQILQREPNHSEALHLLGALVGQKGDVEGAIDLLKRSIQIDPKMAEAHRNLGVLQARGGKYDEAAASFAKAVELRPGMPQYHLDLGKIFMQQNRLEEAIGPLSQAVKLNGNLVEPHIHLGDVLTKLGRFDEALPEYQIAAKLKPDLPEIHFNLGNILAQKGHAEEAIAAYGEAIRLRPEYAAVYFALGHAYRSVSAREQALAAYQRSAEIRPQHLESAVSMAMVLADLQRFDEATAWHERAKKINSESALTHEAMGHILLRQRGAAAAIGHLRRAVEIDPNLLSTWSSLGLALQSQGEFEEAAACFRRMLDIRPNLVIAHKQLVSTSRQKASHDQIQPLLDVLKQPNLSEEQRVTASFALGTALDDAGRYDEAFRFFEEANALVKSRRAAVGERYEAQDFHDWVSRTIETFTPKFFETRRGWGDESELPVFVVGMPRSGTTLVHQIAASHSRVHGAGELTNLPRISESLRQVSDDPSGLGRQSIQAAATRHLQSLREMNETAVRVIDKLPANLHLVGLIALMFPNSRVIFCRRDERDTCLSCYFQGFASGNIFSFDLADCGHYQVENQRLMEHWVKNAPLKMLEVRYEDVTADLEGRSRRLIDFLGLDWEPACLEFYRAQTTVLTSSVWQVRQPIYQASVGRWRHYEKHLGPLLSALSL